MIARLALLALLAAPAMTGFAAAGPGEPGHSHAHDEFSAGAPGDPKKPARTVMVTMRETSDGRMIYEPKSVQVRRGEQVRFLLVNNGEQQHEFVLASKEDNLKHAELMKKYPDMEHDDPNGKTLAPKAKAELIWRFSKSGEFEFACLIPGHRESGMLGTVGVK